MSREADTPSLGTVVSERIVALELALEDMVRELVWLRVYEASLEARGMERIHG